MGLSGAVLENCFTSVGSPKCQSTDGTQVGILDIADSMTCVYANQMQLSRVNLFYSIQFTEFMEDIGDLVI